MAIWPTFRASIGGNTAATRVDHAIDIERHGAVEAVEVDIADVERRIHAGAEQREVDRPEFASIFADCCL